MPFFAWLIGLGGACEFGLRAVGFQQVPSGLESDAAWDPDQDPLFPLNDGLHARDARLLWSPIPGAPIAADGDERINASGYRGPELFRWKTPGVLRIALLSDEATFGATVSWNETYAAQLALRMEEPAEVLNAAVIGFTVEQGIERYAQLVRSHHPDVVVIAFGGIEEARPALATDDRSKLALLALRTSNWPWTAPRASLDLRSVQALLWLVGGEADHPQARLKLRAFQAQNREAQAGSLADNGAVEWKGQRRVPVWIFEEALQRLVELVLQDGARAVLLSMPRDQESEHASTVLVSYASALHIAGQRANVPLCDARRAFRREIAQGVEASELLRNGSVLTARGNALLADLVADTIATSGTN